MAFSKIYNILVDILGESKQGSYSRDREQYSFNCPQCAIDNGGIPDNKHNLEILLSSDGLVYHCWKCGEIEGTKGNLFKLIKKYGTPSQYHDFKDEVTNLVSAKLYDINLFKSAMHSSPVDDEIVVLPKTYTKIDIAHCRSKKLLAFLEKRRIDQNLIDKFNIGYTTWDEEDRFMRNRLIVPSYDKYGDLNYWVGRDFSDYDNVQKYKNCDANKKDIIFQESFIDYDSDIILCEGILDCIRIPNAISLMGKSLTKDSVIYENIVHYSMGRVIIALDNDTNISETKKIYNLLNFGRLKNRIYYLRMDKYKDFSDLYEKSGYRGIINELKSIKQFSEFELLF